MRPKCRENSCGNCCKIEMKITIIRHAMTAGNSKKHYNGRTDEDILETPKCISEDTGIVYVTPLRRTSQTASGMFPNKTQVVVSGLTEMDFGEFEGKSYKDMENLPSYREWVEGGCVGLCPGGESRKIFCERVKSAFLEILDSSDGEDLLFVVHGGVIMAIMHSFCPRGDYFSTMCDNCCGYEFDIDQDLQVKNLRGVNGCI